MFSGHIVGLREPAVSNEVQIEDPVSELDDDDDDYHDDDIEFCRKILYRASFENLARSHVQYETIIWVLISLLLVLAWGVGVLMLLYLPVRRYVLQKDISSRKLYVTPSKIIYKVTKPLFLPFLGVTMIEKRIPLALVIDIIIEQGCMQSAYGIHTVRIESIAHGKAAPVDELLVQGVSNPKLLKKVIMTEASKLLQEVGRGWKPTACTVEGEMGPTQMASINEGSTVGRSPYKRSKNCLAHSDLVLNKVDEVNESVKKLESLLEKSQTLAESS